MSTIAVSKTEIDKLKAEVAKTDTLKQSIFELKAEVVAKSKAKDKAVDGFKGTLKSLTSDFEKLQAKFKKMETKPKLNEDLNGAANMEVESDTESCAPATNKRRRMAPLKTPKNKGQNNLKVPNTDPVMHGSYSMLHGFARSQNLALTPTGTDVAGRPPIHNGPRFQTAHFGLSDNTALARTRAATMASVQSSGYTATGNTRSGSVITVSSLSSVDSDLVESDIFT